MKKVSLRNRILLYFLIVPFGTFLITGILTIIDMHELQYFAEKAGTNITNETNREGSYALQREVRAGLKMLAEGQAKICKMQLNRALVVVNDMVALYKNICAGDYTAEDKGFLTGWKYDKAFNNSFINVKYADDLSKDKIENDLKKITMMRSAFKYSCAYDDYYVGMGIALPNGLFFKHDRFPAPPDYDVRKTKWFKDAIAAKGKLIWLDPALSVTSNKLILTFAQAVVVNNKIKAVIVIDALPQTISSDFVITRGTASFAFLVAPSGEVVAREDIFTKKLIWSLSPAEKTEFHNAIMKKITTGKKNTFSTTFNEKRLNVAFCPVLPGRWGVGVATFQKNIHTSIDKAIGGTGEQNKDYILSIQKYIKRRILIYLGISLGTLIMIMLFAAFTARHLGKPIIQLEAGVEELGKRKLNERININSNDEFQELGETFNAMAAELNNQIRNLRDNITQQERAKNELFIAAEIQRAMLPDVSMPFPEHDEFEIYAEMHPAKEVGGDFYDFFFVDEKHLFFSIGDISGKGLPAALFMMRSLTLLRHEAKDKLPPDQILLNVGNELEHNNEQCMFFTGICGLLDITNGEIVLSNGGHPLPYLRHKDSFESVKTENGMIIGALQLLEKNFSITKLKLKKDDTLFFYTDGVTEAFNAKGKEYTNKRLEATLQKLKGADPREMLEGVSKSIKKFTGDAPQSDDITMMTIKYYG